VLRIWIQDDFFPDHKSLIPNEIRDSGSGIRVQGFEMEKERKNFQKMCKIGIRPVIGLPDPDF
jgi:hypothetical protein